MENNKVIQVTQSGYDALKTELDELVNTKRPQLVERLERARNEGDLSENSDYTNAREELEFLDGRIEEITNVVENAVIIADSTEDNGTVMVGTEVIIETHDGAKHTFKIVGDWEADPINKKISHESPLGQALMDRKVGDKVEVEAPAGKLLYTVVSIK